MYTVYNIPNIGVLYRIVPSSKWEFSMNILKLIVKRAPERSIFGKQWLFQYAGSPQIKANGHTGVAMALQNDLQKTKLKNEIKVKATEESAIREQVIF